MGKIKHKIPQDYAEAYLLCRDPSVRHPWIEDEQTGIPSSYGGAYARVFACLRCQMVKIVHFSGRTHERVGPIEYRMPPGFKLEFKPLTKDLRREAMRRRAERAELPANVRPLRAKRA